MSNIHLKGKTAERFLAKALWAQGFCYRKRTKEAEIHKQLQLNDVAG